MTARTIASSLRLSSIKNCKNFLMLVSGYKLFLTSQSMRPSIHLTVISTFVFCTSVSAQPAKNDYVEVYRYAYMALQEGKWLIYQKLMRSVIDKSTAVGAPPEKRAIFWYEYGRASGVVCDWEDAEFALTVANNLDAKTGRSVHMSLNELGRINVATKQYKKAVEYFTQSLLAFAQSVEKNPEKKITNLGDSALYLEEFAFALEQTGGQASDVKKLRDSAAEIRAQLSSKDSVLDDITPYGTQCKPR